MTKKIISLILAINMILMLLPNMSFVYAEGVSDENIYSNSTTNMVESSEAPGMMVEKESVELFSANGTGKYQISVSTYLYVRSEPSTNGQIVGTLYNGDVIWIVETSGNWGRYSGGWISLNYANWLDSDTEAPSISNIRIGAVDNGGFNILCDVTDNNSGVSHVLFPTWTTSNQSDLIWEESALSGNTADCRINISSYNNVYGYYMIHIYAYDNAGNGSAVATGGFYYNKYEDNMYTYITHNASGKVLGISEDNNVELQTKNSTMSQIWKMERRSDGSYYFLNGQNGYALDVNNASASAGANVAVCPLNGSDAQRWYLNYRTDGAYLLRAKCTGCVLDVNGGGSADGTNIQMCSVNNSSAQNFGISNLSISDFLTCIDFLEYSDNQIKANGWAISKSGNMPVSYQIDDNEEVFVEKVDASDVHNVYPSYPEGSERFGFSIPAHELRNGKHTIVLKTYIDNKYELELKRLDFESYAVETPSINITNISGGKKVAISCATEDAEIYYTLDGSDPNDLETRQKYTSSITLTQNGVYTIKAVGIKSGYGNSDIEISDVTLSKLSIPTVEVQNGKAVILGEGNIYYTTNGTTPTLSSNKYSSPFGISNGMTIKALTAQSGTAASEVSTYYTIVYNLNGGTGTLYPQVIKQNSKGTITTTVPAKTGHIFKGWATSSSSSVAGYKSGSSYTATKSLSLYAVWDKEQYEIQYNANGGVGEPSTQTKLYGNDIVLSSLSPLKENYVFKGWSLNSNDSVPEYQPGDKYTLNSKATLYAVWEKKSFKITYNANGGVNPPEPQYKIYGEELVLSDDIPQRDGYEFVGWTFSDVGNVAMYKPGGKYTIDAEITLYAVWTPKVYSVTLNTNGGIINSGNVTSYIYLSGTVLPTDLYKSGYTFEGWYDNLDLIGNKITAITADEFGDKIYYAKWSTNPTAVVTYDYSFNGGETVTKNSASVEIGTPADLSPVATKSGWSFVGWNTDANATTALKIYNVTGNVTLYAIYKKTMKANFYSGNNILQETKSVTIYNKATSGVVLAPVVSNYSGWTSSGWRDDTEAADRMYNQQSSIELKTDMNYYAAYYRILMLSYNANGGNNNPLSQTDIQYYNASGNKTSKRFILSEAISREGYVFQHWAAGNVNGVVYKPGNEINIDSDTVMYAVWGENPKADAPDIIVSDEVGGKIVTMSTATNGATIYYTTDGSAPTTSSSKYSGIINLKSVQTTTINAMVVASGYENSEVASKSITVSKVSEPIASVLGGVVTGATNVSFACATNGAVIYYTTDGSEPTTSSMKYNGAISVNKTVTLKAIAVAKGYVNSDAAEYYYIFKEPVIVPTPPPVDISKEPLIELSSVVTNGSNINVSGKIINEGNWDIQNVSCVIDCVNSKNNAITQEVAVKYDYTFTDTLRWTNNESLLTIKALLSFEFNGKEYSIESNVCQCMIANRGLKNIEISPRSVNMSPSEKTKLLVSTSNSDVEFEDYSIQWDSANDDVAKIVKTQTGEVEIEANSVGRTRITASIYSKGKKVASTSAEIAVSDRYVPADYDFSEWNMYKSAGTANRKNGWDVNDGSAVKALGYLTRWNGVIEEKIDPYDDAKSGQIDTAGKYHVQEAIFVSPKANQDEGQKISLNEAYIRDMKSMLMTYGGIYASIYYNERFFADSKQTYYFCPYKTINGKKISANHAITIVGWDDDIAKSKFAVEGTIPRDNGAFICKNSYGTGKNDEGYFYISYDDVILGTTTSTVFNNVEAFNNNSYNKIYQYDYLGATAAVTLDSNDKVVYCANVFTNDTDLTETLKAVSTYVYNEGQKYNVYVIKNVGETVEEKREALANGLTLSNLKAGGTLEYMGYYTFDLDNEVEIEPGENFAVVIKLMSDKNAHFYLETKIHDEEGNVSYSNATANDGESFVSRDGKDWLDCNSEIGFEGANVCVKAFTKTSGSEITVMRADIDEEGISLLAAELVSGGLGTDITVGASQASQRKYKFPKMFDLRDNYVTNVKDQGTNPACWAFATYGSMESCLKKKFASIDKSKILEGASEDEYLNIVNGYVDVTGIVVDEKQKQNASIIAVGDTKSVNAYVLPGNATNQAIVWKSSDESIAVVDASGNITGVSNGIVYITASDESGKYNKMFAVSVVDATTEIYNVVLDNNELRVQKGQNFFIDYIVNPLNSLEYTIEITSDDTSVILVDENGILDAQSLGTANIQIKAIAKDGTECISVCHVTVDDGNALDLRVVDNSFSVYQGMTFGGVNVEVYNKTNDTIMADIYIACYDEDGCLLTVKKSTETLTTGENITSYNNLSIKGTVKTIKVFAWGSNLEPYAFSIESIIE